MRLTEFQDLNEVISDVEEELEFDVAPDKFGMIFRMFYEYSDPISSLVREITSNCIDSHSEARDFRDLSIDQLLQAGYGKDIKDEEDRFLYIMEMQEIFKNWISRSVTVEMVQESSFNGTPALIKFHDYGVGLSPDRISRIYSKFGSSTKSATNNQIGAFGLGAKSPLGYTSMFTVKTRWQGVERIYAIHRTSKAPVIKPLGEEPTERTNGTTVEVVINENDWQAFGNAIRTQLAYFDGIEYVNCDAADGVIYQGDNFLFREGTPFMDIHLALGKVYYPLNLAALNMFPIQCPVAIRVTMDEITGPDPEEGSISIVWNRENLQYNAETQKTIKAKLEAVKEELINIYSNQKQSIDTFEDFLLISEGKKKATLEIADGVKIPGVSAFVKQKVEYPKYGSLKKLPSYDFFYDWEVFAQIQYGKGAKTKYHWGMKDILNRENIIVYYLEDGKFPSPRVNEFLYRGLQTVDFLIIRKKSGLDDRDHWIQFGYSKDNPPTEDEKILIDGFRGEVDDYVRSRFKPYKEVSESEAYREWEKEDKKKKKEAKRLKRARKGEEQIPIRYMEVDPSNRAQSLVDTFKWTQAYMDQVDAEETTSLLIYGFQDDDSLLRSIAPAIFANANFHQKDSRGLYLNQDKVMILKIAIGNEKHFKDNPRAMHITDFVNNRNKVLVRYVTCYFMLKKIPVGFDKLVSDVMKKVDLDIHKSAIFLQKYIATYYVHNHSVALDESLLDNFYNLEINRRKIVKKNIMLQNNILKKNLPKDVERRLLLEYKIPEIPAFFDDLAIEHLKKIRAYIERYPLLLALDLDKAKPSDLKEYIKLKARNKK